MRERLRGRRLLIAAVICLVVGVAYGAIYFQKNAFFSMLIVGVGLILLVRVLSAWLHRLV